ncbi:hypothetical protein BG015_011100 [Linnemannia schmuckeri]|uniref:HCP-like protein n=1 Tax=Linnemannia schmuckeri TaxID=64567 RepID=A0A9P5V8L4_9FUNG|nr:hypothetical protein BG015_011100 [Linnemannia schmuckeri]
MTQIGAATQEHVQGFRSVHKSEPPSTTSAPLDSANIIHIVCHTDPDTNKDFILWEDIQQAFDDALFVRDKTKMISYVKGKDYKALEPRRIHAVPNVVLDAVVGSELPTASGTVTADLIVSLQRTVQELSLNTPRHSLTARSPSCNGDPEIMQCCSHTNSPENAPTLREPREFCVQDNTQIDAINTQSSGTSNNTTKRLDDPQDNTTTTDMSLIQTMVNANHGDANAMVTLGDRYKDGREVHKDDQTAIDWYCKAAEQGHPRAQYNVGLLHEQGYGDVPQDHAKAYEWFLKSAVQGYVDAQAKVSQAYTKGTGVPKDNIKAMEWAVKAAENGHAEMQYNMGAAYEKGRGVPQSDSMSFEWYLKSAEQGFAAAQVRVAEAFNTAQGVPQNDAKAVEWYFKAADQGLAEAQFSLGRLYEQGTHGLPKDKSKAVDWYLKAAVQDHTEAQLGLRNLYCVNWFNSAHFVKDPQTQSKIKEWFIVAADQGVVHAQFCMGDMYSYGRGVDRDNSKAFEWYLKAAEQRDEKAQLRVVYWYYYGIGVSKNREKSIERFVGLAARGNAEAVQHVKDMLLK